MDPYKLLGISAHQVKHDSDLDKVRHRAKQLYKRRSKEGNKFDAKKILEAYDLIKQNLKSRPGEGQYKILGRSRKERELDKHFNHQTKEIKKNKRLKRTLEKAMRGKERIHLPGDKERIPRPRRRRHHRDRRRRRHEQRKRRMTDVNILEGLHRLAKLLPQEQKFPKVIKLLHTWMREYMNIDTREFVFKVLDGVAHCDFLTNNPDARQDIVEVFEYALGYFSEWFGKGDENTLFGSSWQVATVLACRCFTDDAFVLSSTLAKLADSLALLEKHKDHIGEDTKKEEDEVKKEDDAKVKAKEEDESSDEGKPENGGMAVKEETEEKQAAKPGNGERAVKEEKEAKVKVAGVKAEEKAVKAEEKNGRSSASSATAKSEEVNGKVKAEEKRNVGGGKPLISKPLIGLRGIALAMAAPVAPSPAPLASPVSLDSASGDEDGDFEVLSSGGSSGSCVDVGSDEEVLDVGSDDDSVDVKEEIDIGSGGSSDGEADSDGAVEEVEGSIFSTPRLGRSLARLRTHFVDRCLATLFRQRNPLWARPKIDAFFQDVFYRRAIFSPEQQQQVEEWQSRIKTMQRLGERNVGEANNPLEAQRPVVDSREMRAVIDSDSNVWAGKQTFDSRESAASRVIR